MHFLWPFTTGSADELSDPGDREAMDTFSPRRAAAVFSVLGALFVVLIGRVAYLQTYGRQLTIRKAERQQHQTMVQQARRGSIFDRNGFLLAGTIQTQTLFVDPKYMYEVYQQDGHSLVEMDAATIALANLIDKQPLEVAQLLADRSSYRFVKVAENLDEATCTEIQKLKLPGVGLQPTSVRYYPMGSLAAHLMGGTMKDGHGLDGLELEFDKMLSGKDGYARILKDASHRPLAMTAEDYLPPQHGQHLILTIDANIQMIAEQELATAVTENHAKRGEVVVMDPKTGEVLALANYPTFNPQAFQDAPPEVRRNSTLVMPYEPGSTIKPFIMGPALAWHITRPEEIWPIPGMSYNVPNSRRVIKDVHAYGPLATWDVLVKSSNIGMSMLGERMGNARLSRALNQWGFGRPTGIELPGEEGGVLRPLKQWNSFTTESVSQGYEIMVTPLQLARAFCAYANGGRLVRPTLIKGYLDADDHVVPQVKLADFRMLPEALDPMTAAEMKRIMCDVVVRGTATKARSDWWNIFGKTGTAHISEGKRGYSLTRFNSSFLCGAPAENPRLVVAMIVHEPDKSIAHYGGNVSGPAAKRLVERALSYYQVPSSPDLPLPPPKVADVLVGYNEKVYQRHHQEDLSTAVARE
jgi:cell division protein FtsI (penicillin-binding protein 3)